MKKFILKIIWFTIIFIIVLLFAFCYFFHNNKIVDQEPVNIKKFKMSEIQPLKKNEFWEVTGDGYHVFLTKRAEHYLELAFYKPSTGAKKYYVRHPSVGERISGRYSYNVQENYIIKEAFFIESMLYVIGDLAENADHYSPKIYGYGGEDEMVEINQLEDSKTYGTCFYKGGIIVITNKRILYYKDIKGEPEVLWKGIWYEDSWDGYTPFTCAVKKDTLYIGGTPYICEFNLKDKTMNFLYPAQ